MNQSPTLGVAVLVASAAAVTVLAALVAAGLVTCPGAAVLFLARVAVRLAEVRVTPAALRTVPVVALASW